MAQMIAKIVEKRRRQAIQEMEQYLTAPDLQDPATVAENIMRKKKAAKKQIGDKYNKTSPLLAKQNDCSQAARRTQKFEDPGGQVIRMYCPCLLVVMKNKVEPCITIRAEPGGATAADDQGHEPSKIDYQKH